MHHSLRNYFSFTKPLIFSLILSAVFVSNAISADNSQRLQIETAPATVGITTVERVFDGTVEAVQQATVSAETNGRIEEINFDVDDFVEAGSVLIRFTDVEQKTDLQRAEADLLGARARMVEANKQYARAENLKERGLGSQRDLDQALATRKSASASVTSAESAVVSARQQLEYTVVRAPYSGIVTERHIQVGETVSRGQPLISGLSLEKLRVIVDLPQQAAIEVRRNPRATVLTELEPVTPEKITIFPMADPVTKTFRVRLELPDGQFDLFPGMFVKASFQVGEAERLLIPATAIVQRSEVIAVYVLENDEVRLRQIRVGATFGDQVEVLAGLTAGEQIALDPVQAGIYAKTSKNLSP
ncbi:MAG: efflux RND transporter periplasmic adaptor subunit [Lysobacterales bacterium]